MTQKINTGGPAFPIAVGDHEYVADGMTLRDWFAGQALTGTLLAPGQLGLEAQNSPDKAAHWEIGRAHV